MSDEKRYPLTPLTRHDDYDKPIKITITDRGE